jgi:excisionase family DNA binding protein
MTKLTTTQAAAKLGVSRSWLRHLIRDGKLKAEKIGRDWLIEEFELDALGRGKIGRPRSGGSMD